MTGAEKLGWVIADALGAEEGYRVAILARGIGQKIIKAAVEHSEELAVKRTGLPEDYALELSDDPVDRQEIGYLQEGWGKAVGYRSGAGRLFYSVDGKFGGGASLSNASTPVLSSDFPGEGGGKVGLGDISGAVERLFRSASPDIFSAGNWTMFNEAVLGVITFTAKLFEEAGNQDLGQWQLGWWNHLEYLLDQLDTYFVENQGKLGDFRPAQVFSLAGLPKPREDNVSYQYIDSRKYWNAFTEYWSDAEKAIDSCSYLEIIHKKELGGLDWGQYQGRISSQGHSVLALTTLANKTPGSSPYEFWRGIDELDFLRRSKGENDPFHNLRVRFKRVVGVGEEQECPKWYPKTHLVPLFLQEPGGKDWSGEYKIIFEDIAYIFDGQGSLDPNLLSAVVKAPVEAIVNKIEVEPESGQPHLVISIGLKISLEDEDTAWPTSPVDFSLELKGPSKGLGALESERKLKVKLLFPNPGCFPSLFIEAKEGRRRPRLMVFNKERAPGEVEVIRLTALPARGDLYVFDPRALSNEKTEGFASFKYQSGTVLNHDLPGLSYSIGQSFADDAVIEGDEESVAEGSIQEILARISVDSQPKNPPWLPLIATAQGVSPRHHSELVPENDSRDLRGILESKMTRAAMDACEGESPPRDYGLVQAMLPIGGGAQDREFGRGKNFVWLGESNDMGLQYAGHGPSDFLCDSEEFRRFWDALGKILQETDLYANRDIETLWFSRCALVGPDPDGQEVENIERLVNAYLVAYTELVKLADDNAGQDGEGDDRIWARYPFAAMVVDSGNSNGLAGVLLSPLHPIRLAWLYAAERAAERSCNNRGGGMTLLQVLEGWNFPWIGPAPAPFGNNPIMTAVPTDDGESKLLSGWSYLVGPVGPTGLPIRPSAVIAGYSGPGAASSGLTAGGMISAIRDYIRVHPYISTLSLDLASGSKGPRSAEMDRGLLNEISNLGIDQKLYDLDLRGGVRVYDSMNRQLPPPDAEEEMVGDLRGSEGNPIPFSWQRYDPKWSPDVDLSFVEQSTANFTALDGKADGSVTHFPVRRFMPFETPESGGQLRMHVSGVIDPGIGAGWPEFKEALYAMESRDGKAQDLLVNTQAAESGKASTAAWTVTGNIQISPSLLSQQAARNDNMLWEWRPGFLPRKMAQVETAAFGIRPYSITAKIPEAFKKAVTDALTVSGHQLDPKRLFSELGRRGVGLASLLAMGGNHVYGALGFYLGYELIDKLLVRKGVHRLVVPIDAVDLIFRAVCGEDLVEETKRADLLIIDIDKEGKDVNFVPVEIRCSLRDSNNFPSPEGGEVAKKLAQLSASKSVIKKALVVLGEPDEQRPEIRQELSLEQAAIATVIECGLSLRPEISGNQADIDVGKILSNVSGTDTKFKTKGGLLFWFQRGPEEQLAWSKDEPESETGCLFVNTDGTPLVEHEPAMGWEEEIEDVGRWLGALGAKEDDAVPSPSEDTSEDAGGSTAVDPQEPSPIEPSEVAADSDPGEEDEADAGVESKPVDGAEDDSPGTEDEPVDLGEEQADGAGAAEATPADGEEAAPPEEPGPKDESPGSSATAKELLRRAREKAREMSERGGKTDGAGAVSDDDGCRRPKVDVGADPEGKRVIWDPLRIEQSLPNSHWVILGTSGTGKTQTIKAIVGELAEQGVIPVILDFNDDYYDEEYCLNIGANRVHVSSAGLPINPLEPAPDTTPEKAGQALVINQVYALADNLQKVFDLGDQQNNYLKNALKEVYKGAGISTSWVSIEDTPFPQFNELKEHLETPGWGENTKRDERVINRLQALFDLEIFNSGQEGTFEDLMETPSVIRLTDLPGDKTKEAVAELFLMSFYNFMLKKGHNNNLQYLVVVDEAHKIANLKAMDKLIRESRKYGVGVVVSSQQSGDFPDSVFANAGTLLSLGLQARADVRLVSQFIAGTGSQKVSEVASELRNLDPFNGILYNDHYKDPYVKVRITPYFQRAVSKSK